MEWAEPLEPLQWEDNSESAIFFSDLSVMTASINILVALVGAAYVYIRRFLASHRRDHEAHRLPEDEVAENSLHFWACVLCVAVGFGAVLLVPVSILSEAARRCLKDSLLEAILPPYLVLVLWRGFFVASNVCHYCVVPFAYLYPEAEGIGRRRGVLWRCIETGVVLLLVLSLTQVLLYLVQRMLGFQQLTFSYLLSSFVGSIFFLLLAPFGFRRILQLSLALYVPLGVTRETVMDRVEALQLEIASEQNRAMRANEHRSRSDSSGSSGHERENFAVGGAAANSSLSPPCGVGDESSGSSSYEGAGVGASGFSDAGGSGGGVSKTSTTAPSALLLLQLQRELRHNQSLLVASPWLRRLTSVVAVTISLGLSILVLFRVLYLQIFPPVVGSGSGSVDVVASGAAEEDAQQSISNRVWTLVVTILDLCLIVFLWVATLCGKRDFPLSRFRRRSSDEKDALLSHSAVLLLMGSSLPLVSWNLGLTNFDGASWEKDVAFFHNNYVGRSFNTLFFLALLWVIARAVRSLWTHTARKPKKD